MMQRLKSPITAICLIAIIVLMAGCSVQRETPDTSADGKTVQIDPAQWQKLELLNETADKMYQYIKSGNVLEARNQLMAIGDQVTRIRFDGITTVEGLNALTQLLTESKRIYSAVQFSPDEGMAAAAKIRLAADALTHRNQPMWYQYDRLLEDSLNRMEKAVNSGDKRAATVPWDELQRHYGMIRPCLLISRAPEEVERADSLFVFLGSRMKAQQLQTKELQTGISELRKTFDQVFLKKEAAAYLPIAETKQPLLWSLSIGSAIVLALAYAAWRMFGTEKNLVFIDRKNK
jgi:sporulation protein YpjB